jgi:ribosomal protein L16 Arg81 hydroxylase
MVVSGLITGLFGGELGPQKRAIWTRRVFTQDQAFNQIPEAQRETVVTRIAKAANGSSVIEHFDLINLSTTLVRG